MCDSLTSSSDENGFAGERGGGGGDGSECTLDGGEGVGDRGDDLPSNMTHDVARSVLMSAGGDSRAGPLLEYSSSLSDGRV